MYIKFNIDIIFALQFLLCPLCVKEYGEATVTAKKN